MASVRDIARDFLARGGKRLRPRLCETVFRACGGVAGDARLTPLLTAIECFHKASLVHDDIQDGDEMRYGAPSVWKEHGIAVAIAVGDWLVAYGYGLIADSGFTNAAEMLKAVTASHLQLCEGQGDDVSDANLERWSDDAAYFDLCARKTGEAFALAAELGALAAGVQPAPYRAWARLWGTLFQIRDDLSDSGPSERLVRFERTFALRTAEARPPALRDDPVFGA